MISLKWQCCGVRRENDSRRQFIAQVGGFFLLKLFITSNIMSLISIGPDNA